MTADERAAIARAILTRSRADATEVIVASARTALTRFTREAVNQNVDETDTTVRVRAIVNGRVGLAVTNTFAPAALDAVTARAYDIAALAPRERVAPVISTARDARTPDGAFVAATAAATPQTRANVAGAIFGHAGGELWSSGYALTATHGVSVLTSNGADLAFDGTTAAANVKITAADSTGFCERVAADVGEVDGDALGREAARIAVDSRSPIAVEPGDWTVILAPAAFGELLRYLVLHFSAEAYADGSSFIAGRLGTPTLGANVTIHDDFAHPLNPGMPFDFAGFPTQRVTLVASGVASDILTDSVWAQRLERPNTGHALMPPDASGPQSTYTVVEPGTKSLQTLISETGRGLLITRLWYVRNVDQRTVLLTGMTRDGTFLIENGVVTRGVRNLRFNESIARALLDCELADTQVRTGGYHYSLVTPAVKFNHFRFASASPY